MPTQFPDIFGALAAPFDRDEVKSRPQGKQQIRYVTARTVMNRLDDVLGPEGWWDEYAPGEHSVLCRLSICLPDGHVLTKADAGGYAGMADQGDDDKSGFSDSFKRAAVKFGVARYLYGDGTASFATKAPDGRRATPGPARPAPSKPAGKAASAKTQAAEDAERVRLWEAFAARVGGEANADWLEEMRRGGIHEGRWEYPSNAYAMANHLCSRAIEKDPARADEVTKPGKPSVKDPARVRAFVARLYARHPEAVEQVAREYLAGRRSELRAKLGLPDPAAEDADEVLEVEVGSNGDGHAPDEATVDEPGMRG